MSHSLHDFGFLGPIDRYAHGSRPCYQAGCKCLPCRSANALYAQRRAMSPQPGWTEPREAQAHLLTLQAHGIGYRRVAQLAGISRATVKAIRNGDRTRILQRHHAAIVAVRPYPAMGARITSKRAKHLLLSLGSEGFTLAMVAAKLGLRQSQLALHPTVTVKRSLQVQALWRKLTADDYRQAQ